MSRFPKLALLASPGDAARDAEKQLRERHEFVALEDADAVIALGGDGFLLQLLHRLLE
jgi:NAD+ kinase